jgi:hypothetical protein
MSGVPRELAEHSLDVSKTTKPVKQKLHRFEKDRKEVIRVEIIFSLARQPGACTQENRSMDNVYRLH